MRQRIAELESEKDGDQQTKFELYDLLKKAGSTHDFDDGGLWIACTAIKELQQRIATLEAACEASARWYKFHKRGFPIATPQAEELMVHYLRAAGYLK